jgi:hypothetical protein
MNSRDQRRHDISQKDALIAAWLRGEIPPADSLPADLMERVVYHGVSALLAARPAVIAALPDALRGAIRQQALSEAMWDLQHRRVLAPLLEDLAREGIPAAVLKGTALACSVYPSPALRPRGDTDLLVAKLDLPQVRSLLARYGFRRSWEHLAERRTQEEWARPRPEGGADCVDVHWNLLSPWALSALFDTSALLAEAQPVPRLSPGALMLSYPYALLHACVHRARHVHAAYFIGSQVYYGGDRLIWLVDLDLLARSMTEAHWDAFADFALATDTARIAHDALLQAVSLLDTPVLPRVMARLTSQKDGGEVEAYLIHASLPRRLWADLRALPQGQSRLAFLREILLPPAQVMRKDFPDFAHLPLYRLHLHRFARRLHRLRLERQQRRTR